MDRVIQFAAGSSQLPAALGDREFLVVMHIIYVAHRQQLAPPSPGPGSGGVQRDRAFSCVL